jgi:hypothetical protein
MTIVNRRTYLRAAAGLAAASTVGLAGCAGGSTGTFSTRVSDQPGDIGDFESCVITITEVWIKPLDEELIEESVDDVEADLVELQGDSSQLVDDFELPTGEYEFVQLRISNVEAVLDGGGEATVSMPGDAPLKFETFHIDGESSDTFEIRGDERTVFTADFTPVKRGQTEEYVLQPVADEVTVSYESEE